MRIKRLEISRLYGSFTKSIDFDSGLNLLVGINGSGKTSILNCIEWLTKPNLARLACTHFHSIKVFLDRGDKSYEIFAQRNTHLLSVQISGGGFDGDPLTIKIERPSSSIKNEEEMDEALQYYSSLTPEAHERKTWSFLKGLPDPLSVSLDRTIAAESEGEVYFEGRTPRGIRQRSPISKIQNVARLKYAAYSQKLNSLNESLKSKIIVSAFRSSLLRMPNDPVHSVTISELDSLESKVTNLLYTSLEIDSDVAESITQYFEEARQILHHGEKDPGLRRAFYAQYRQIHGLAEAFRDFDIKSAKAFEALNSYLTSLNSFFRESGKVMGFNEVDGTLGFKLIGKEGGVTGTYLSIDRMSSGEKQLLILITLLAFVAKRNHIYIIDEPELSLHPRWQRSFVGAIMDQSPPGTQVIMATHSPEIVSKYRDKCVVLDV